MNVTAKDLQAAITKSRRRVIDPEEFLEQIVAQWGGTAAIVECMYNDYKAAAEGSLVRKNIMEVIASFIRFNYEKKGEGQKMEDMETADLEAIAKEILNAPGTASPA